MGIVRPNRQQQQRHVEDEVVRPTAAEPPQDSGAARPVQEHNIIVVENFTCPITWGLPLDPGAFRCRYCCILMG